MGMWQVSLKLMQHPLGAPLILASTVAGRYVVLRFLSHCQHPSGLWSLFFCVLLPSFLPLSAALALAFIVRPECGRVNVPRSNPQQRDRSWRTNAPASYFLGSHSWRSSAYFSGGLSGVANTHFNFFFFLSCVSGPAHSLMLPQISSQIILLHSKSCSRFLLGKNKTRTETL